jgi:hypothetical protein
MLVMFVRTIKAAGTISRRSTIATFAHSNFPLPDYRGESLFRNPAHELVHFVKLDLFPLVRTLEVGLGYIA